jgi:hypothetical protein
MAAIASARVRGARELVRRHDRGPALRYRPQRKDVFEATTRCLGRSWWRTAAVEPVAETLRCRRSVAIVKYRD